jgi:DNA helicase-2/ATP-dependent DNA helicase PcrA
MFELDMLNEEQKAVVLANTGVVCCTATAGSGKTFAMTKKVAYLISEGIRPERILCFTFTKKAGTELGDRLKNILSREDSSKVTVGTMHSVFYSIVRKERMLLAPEYHNMKIILEWQQKKLMKEAYDSVVETMGRSGKNPFTAYASISRAKNELLSPELLRKYLVNSKQEHLLWISNVYAKYEAAKKKEGFIDFDDMITMAYDLLCIESVKAKWQKQWDYIMVDEFQDTNTAQAKLVKILSEKAKLLFLIGDKNQAIYAFRGARPDYIEGIEKHYPDVVKMSLSTTYRCRENIVAKANLLTNLMGGVKSKAVKTGGTITYLGHFETSDEEAEAVAREIRHLFRTAHVKPQDIKIMYRTNVQSRAIEEALCSSKIPYVIFGDNSFYDQKEAKDMIAYLKIILNPQTARDCYLRILNRPPRKLGSVFKEEWDTQSMNGRDCLDSLCYRYKTSFTESCAKDMYRQIRATIEYAKTADNVGQIITSIRRETGYDDWLESDVENVDISNDAAQRKIDILDELCVIASRHSRIEDFLSHVEAVASRKEKNAGKSVNVMTVHKAKGLEAQVVFVVGVSNGLMPHHQGLFNEERRLFYVAITRAEERLYLSGYAEKNKNDIMNESIFLKYIEVIEYEES